MRRFAGLILALMLLFLFIFPAGAATEASSVTGFATVGSDGSCRVSLTVTLHLTEPVTELYFPIPKAATTVSLNGGRASAPTKGDVRQVNLTKAVRNIVGDVTVNIQYSLHDVIVTTEENTLQLQLPLLSGFTHSVKKLDFSVTLPGAVDTLPSFHSGYHQNRIEERLVYEVNGPVISGSTVRELMGLETLTMTLAVQESMFPQGITKSQDYHWATTAMLICGGIALLYWLLTMFNRPGFARTQPEPPQGYHAGNLGSALVGRGFDLTMAVLHWAQLGYILIHVKGQRVYLYKQMEMGNERSDTELKWFHKLFAKKTRVDTTEYRYANLCRLAAKKPDQLSERMKRWNGNPVFFRGLTALIGLFAGMSLAVAMAEGAALQGFLMVLFGLAGAVSGWYLQLFGYGLILRDSHLLKISLTNSTVWLLISLLAGSVHTGLLLLFEVLTLSLLLAWGGRRTLLGRQVQMQTLGFIRFLRRAHPAELQRHSRSDPDYFFRLAPSALALGREKLIARRFGDHRLDGCPYLTTGMDGHMTALQWSIFMRNTVKKMNGRAKRLQLEKLLKLLSRARHSR